MAEINPLDLAYDRLTSKKSNLTVAAGRTEVVFHEDNENGVVQEVVLYCTGDLTLEISLGTDIDSMSIANAKLYNLRSPNTSFWLPQYDSTKHVYCLAYQPFNLQPYKGSVTVTLKNGGSASVTANKIILKRIRAKIPPKAESGQEYAPYSVQPGDNK